MAADERDDPMLLRRLAERFSIELVPEQHGQLVSGRGIELQPSTPEKDAHRVADLGAQPLQERGSAARHQAP
jgi:hypothetical protein